MDDRDISVQDGGTPPRAGRLLPVLAKAALPFLLIGGTVALVLVLHFNGTLRAFLDRQSMGGMIVVVLVVNAVGFSFVYMAAMAWKTIKREFWPSDDF